MRPFEYVVSILLIAVLLIIVRFFLRKRSKKEGISVHEEPSVYQEFSINNETFRAEGKKNNFWISKGNRFEFHVVDGNIVSFVDKSVSEKEMPYMREGEQNGIN